MELDAEERQDDLNSLGVQEGGLESLIQATYHLPGLRTSFTMGPKGNRAWSIRAQTIGWQQLLEAGSMVEARSRGWLRSEGRDHVVVEGDVMEFLFNV